MNWVDGKKGGNGPLLEALGTFTDASFDLGVGPCPAGRGSGMKSLRAKSGLVHKEPKEHEKGKEVKRTPEEGEGTLGGLTKIGCCLSGSSHWEGKGLLREKRVSLDRVLWKPLGSKGGKSAPLATRVLKIDAEVRERRRRGENGC